MECLETSHSDKFQFWHIPILTNSNSDKFPFWQFPILTNSNSDKFQFWQIPTLAISNSANSNSDKFRSPLVYLDRFGGRSAHPFCSIFLPVKRLNFTISERGIPGQSHLYWVLTLIKIFECIERDIWDELFKVLVGSPTFFLAWALHFGN